MHDFWISWPVFTWIKKFELIGEQIGLLFQIVHDLIDLKSSSKRAGKKTKKDMKKGKATLIKVLGYQNTVDYRDKLKFNILNKILIYGKKSKDLKDTINYIVNRSKWIKIINI